MFPTDFSNHVKAILKDIESQGLYKNERFIDSMQDSVVRLKDGREVINMCANNYLGLADNPTLIAAAHKALDRWGYGMASVRFICGTQTLHKELEARISKFLGTEDTILYASCFDANGGLFESLLTAEDAIISDELNHASIIDGVRLCKAKRYRYHNNDMADLEAQILQAKADGARFILISTDGVFSMDGIICSLDKVYALAEKHGVMVHHDDSHSTGFLGKTGRGTQEYCGVKNMHITTSTLGKALGGASGGYTSGPKEIIDLLRQRSRPYLFSNTVVPAVAATTLAVLDMLESDTSLRDKLEANTKHFREAMTSLGFTISGKDHPISPVMLGDAALSQVFADKLLEKGVYAVGFFYPVVPKGKARIRTQISAAHTTEQLDKAIEAFASVGRELGIIK